MPERARTDLWEPQGSNPLGPPGPNCCPDSASRQSPKRRAIGAERNARPHSTRRHKAVLGVERCQPPFPSARKWVAPSAPAMCETSLNCWQFSVINEAGSWEYSVDKPSRTSWMAA